jgi:adenine specific DNA methylase Mod
MTNTLFYGDNLAILPQLDAATVDLVYLDPPFNSNRDYNVLFKEQSGKESPAQIKAFGDTWNWVGAALGFFVTLEKPTKNMLSEALSAGFYKAKTGVGSNISFKSAAQVAAAAGQGGLDL